MVSISTINSAALTQSVSNTASTVVPSTTAVKTTSAPTISTTNSSTVKVSSAALTVVKAATASTVTVSVADVLKAGYTPLANTVIKDTAANIQTNLKAIAAITPAANITGITLSDTAKGTISVARADVSGDLSIATNSDPEVLLLKKITTAYNLSVTGLAASDALTLKSTGTAATLTMSVSDTATNLATNLDALQTKVKAKSITALNLTADPAQTSKPMLSMTAKQLTADVDALASLKGDFDLTVTGVLAADALKTAGAADAVLKKSGSTSTLSKITIADTAANITKSIATLETAATAGRLTSITVTDNAALNLTESQALADADVLKVQFTTQTKLNITNMVAKDVGSNNASDVDFNTMVKNAGLMPSGVTTLYKSGASSDGNLSWGNYQNGNIEHGFILKKDGTFTDIPPPPNSLAQLVGVSKDGLIKFGYTRSSAGQPDIFKIDQNGNYTIIKVPQNSGDLYFTGFNDDASSITGFYFEANQPSNWDSPRHNFVIDNTNTFSKDEVDTITKNLANVSSIDSYANNKFSLGTYDPISSILPTNSNLKINSETVTDTAANISANLDNIQAAVKAKTVTAITVSDKNPITVSGAAGVTGHTEALAAITNAYTLKVDKLSATDAIALKAPSKNATLSLAITDTVANIAANLDKLQALAKAKSLTAINISDSASAITITAAQLTADADAIKLISGSGGVSVIGVTAADAVKTAATAGVKSITIADSAANILKNATALKTLAASNKITSILINDKTPPTAKIADVLVMQDIGVQDTHGVDGVKYNIADTASNIIAHTRFDIGDVLKNAKLISITDTKTPVLTLADAKTLTSITKLDAKTKYSVADGGTAIASQAAIAGEKVLSGAQAVTINKNYTIAQAKSVLTLKNLDKNNAYAITDTVANILAESNITGSKVLSGATAVNVSDSQGNVFANVDDLEKLTNIGLLSDINLTNKSSAGGFDVSSIWTDSEVLGKILQIQDLKAQTFKATINGINNYGVYTDKSSVTLSLYSPQAKTNNGLTSVWIGDYDGFYNLNNEKGHVQVEFEINNKNINENDGINLINQFLKSSSPQEFDAAIQSANKFNLKVKIGFKLDTPIDALGDGNLTKFVSIPVSYTTPSATDTLINLKLNPANWLDVSLKQTFMSSPSSGSTNSWGSLGDISNYSITGNEKGCPFVSLNSATQLNPNVMQYLSAMSSAKTAKEFDIAYNNAKTAGTNDSPSFTIGFGYQLIPSNGGFGLNYAGLSPDGLKILFKGTNN